MEVKIGRTLNLHTTGSKRVGHILLPKLSHISRQTYVILGGVGGFDACTSTAFPTTDSRSWTTKRRCGWWVASVNDCEPTPPPTSTTSEPSAMFSQVYPTMISIYQSQMSFFKDVQDDRTFEDGIGRAGVPHTGHGSSESNKL
jgi:hypothetical protein